MAIWIKNPAWSIISVKGAVKTIRVPVGGLDFVSYRSWEPEVSATFVSATNNPFSTCEFLLLIYDSERFLAINSLFMPDCSFLCLSKSPQYTLSGVIGKSMTHLPVALNKAEEAIAGVLSPTDFSIMPETSQDECWS
jgi:hypothetical protein